MKTLLLLLMLVSPVLAIQNMTIDLEDLPPELAAQLLAHKAGPTQTPEEWIDFGERIAKSVKTCATELNVAVNDFIKTPAGLITVSIIAWKVAGNDLKAIVFGIPLWIAWLIITLYMRKQYFTYITIDKGSDEKGNPRQERVESYDWYSSEARSMGSVALYGSFILVTVIILIAIIS